MQLRRNPNSPLSTVGTSAFRNETFISSSQGSMNACLPHPFPNLIIVLILQNKDSVALKYKEEKGWTAGPGSCDGIILKLTSTFQKRQDKRDPYVSGLVIGLCWWFWMWFVLQWRCLWGTEYKLGKETSCQILEWGNNLFLKAVSGYYSSFK